MTVIWEAAMTEVAARPLCPLGRPRGGIRAPRSSQAWALRDSCREPPFSSWVTDPRGASAGLYWWWNLGLTPGRAHLLKFGPGSCQAAQMDFAAAVLLPQLLVCQDHSTVTLLPDGPAAAAHGNPGPRCPIAGSAWPGRLETARSAPALQVGPPGGTGLE